MRKILDEEGHVAVPPDVMNDPFFRMTHLVKQEIRKYKWYEGEKGRTLTWEEARKEWSEKHQAAFETWLRGVMNI